MKKIKINHPIGLGLLLLGPMLLAGIASGMAAYQLGHASLKGIGQPDINPAKKFTNDRTNYGRNQTFIPVKEADVIKRVNVYIQQQEKKAKLDKSPKKSPKTDEKQSSLAYPSLVFRG